MIHSPYANRKSLETSEPLTSGSRFYPGGSPHRTKADPEDIYTFRKLLEIPSGHTPLGAQKMEEELPELFERLPITGVESIPQGCVQNPGPHSSESQNFQPAGCKSAVLDMEHRLRAWILRGPIVLGEKSPLTMTLDGALSGTLVSLTHSLGGSWHIHIITAHPLQQGLLMAHLPALAGRLSGLKLDSVQISLNRLPLSPHLKRFKEES